VAAILVEYGTSLTEGRGGDSDGRAVVPGWGTQGTVGEGAIRSRGLCKWEEIREGPDGR
jgi:hypothetical protein